MKFTASKEDLKSALEISGITVSSGDTLASHYLFRIKNGAVEVLSYNLRVFSRALIANAVVEGEEGAAFTTEAWRLSRWVSAVAGNTLLTLEMRTAGEVTASGKKGKIRLRSWDPSKFPYWDKMAADSKVVGKADPSTMIRALRCASVFVAKDDTARPALCQIAAIDGVLWGTNLRALARISMDGLSDLSMSIAGKDVPSVLRFLGGLKDLGTLEVRHAERASGGGSCVMFCSPDGSYLGVTRPNSKFPEITVDQEAPAGSTLTFVGAEFFTCLDILLSGAPKKQAFVTFAYDPESGAVVLSMPCEAGGQGEYPLSSATVENGENWGRPFQIDFTYLKGLVKSFSLTDITLGVSSKDQTGFVTFRHRDIGNDYFIVIVWKPFEEETP